MNTCSPDFLCIAYTLVCESQFVGEFIRMRVTYTAKWGLQIAEMIFQTRSSTSFPHFYIKATNMPRGILLYRAAAYCKIKIGPLDDY